MEGWVGLGRPVEGHKICCWTFSSYCCALAIGGPSNVDHKFSSAESDFSFRHLAIAFPNFYMEGKLQNTALFFDHRCDYEPVLFWHKALRWLKFKTTLVSPIIICLFQLWLSTTHSPLKFVRHSDLLKSDKVGHDVYVSVFVLCSTWELRVEIYPQIHLRDLGGGVVSSPKIGNDMQAKTRP